MFLICAGKTEEGGKYPSNLTAAQVEIREQDDCSQRLRKTILGDYFDLNERFICAGGEKGVDACQGIFEYIFMSRVFLNFVS